MRHGLRERLPPGCAERLEARDLRLDRDAGGPGGVDDGAAVGGDVAPGIRPEPGRIRVQPQDDLGLALGDARRQPVAERRQLLTDFLSLAPAVNFGTFDAAIWIGSPVRGWTPWRALRLE